MHLQCATIVFTAFYKTLQDTFVSLKLRYNQRNCFALHISWHQLAY